MIRNTASQVVSASLVSRTDGSAVTSGTTTVYVTKDGATQATGTGTVTHEGNGEWSYVPTQAETDGVHLAFTFTNSSAVQATVNVYTRPSGTGFPAVDGSGNVQRVILADEVSLVGDYGTLTSDTATAVWLAATRTLTAGTNIQLPSNGLANVTAWSVAITGNITGNLSGSVGSVTGAVGSVTGNVGGNVTGSVGSVVGNVGGNVVGSVASVTGAVGSVTGSVGGNVTGSVGSISGVTFPSNFGVLGINASGHVSRVVLADTATTLTNAPSDSAGTTTLLSRLTSTRAGYLDNLTNLDATVSSRLATASYTAPLDAAGVRTAVGLASANLDTQLDNLPTAAENAAALLDLTDGIETNITPRGAFRLILASAAGKLSGAATTTVAIRNVGDSKTRITATVDSDGNRTAITTDAT